jgi:hypothetical protein
MPLSPQTALQDDAVVAWEACRLFRDHAEPNQVVVAAGDERRPRGRAQRGGMKVGVAQPGVGDPVERRGRYHAAEGAGRGEADVIGHDQLQRSSPRPCYMSVMLFTGHPFASFDAHTPVACPVATASTAGRITVPLRQQRKPPDDTPRHLRRCLLMRRLLGHSAAPGALMAYPIGSARQSGRGS